MPWGRGVGQRGEQGWEPGSPESVWVAWPLGRQVLLSVSWGERRLPLQPGSWSWGAPKGSKPPSSISPAPWEVPAWPLTSAVLSSWLPPC